MNMNVPAHEAADFTPPPFCWAEIGISGDRSCPRMKKYIHCRNCPVYAAAGRSLLEREVAPQQVRAWTDRLAQNRTERTRGGVSVLAFRLGQEWLAVPSRALAEIVEPVPVRRLPHTRGDVLMGLVGLRGEIRLCVSLESLLGLERSAERAVRMCVLGDGEDLWVFPVHEVGGIVRVAQKEIEPVPATLGAGLSLFSRGLIRHNGRKAGLLEEELLLHALERSIR